tara:strand:- start:401 stop:556 length:156 start_codon:yes stop_codon:yes gene_type:complete
MIQSLLKRLYENVWMPFFGRILSLFIEIIEGKKSTKKPTYKFNTSDNSSEK